ncbi:putative glucose uptake permease [Leptolinea tardivitalis]|nr:putative glucose uptake permease [Leptolinea tardivitalis]
MTMSSSFLGILFGLLSALVWGSGDFAGGYASRKQSQYQVLALSAFSGLVFMAITALIFRESFPSTRGIIFSILGGLSGALGIAAFYRSLAIGNAAVVAPTASVIGTALPVLFSTILEGIPSQIKLAGFILAILGIWLVSSGESSHPSGKDGFSLSVLAGIGFAGWLILLGNVEHGKVFTPLVIARTVAFITGLVLVWINRQPLPGLTSNPSAVICGILDVGGNLFYVLARQYTRLDVAAVLSSLGPAVTVIITTIVLKEVVSRRQWLGVVTCLAAVGLITI